MKFSREELSMLKESLNYSIRNVEHSQDYDNTTYHLKREKLDKLGELKNKVSELINTI